MGNRRRPRNRRPLAHGHGHELQPGPGEAWCTQTAIVPDRRMPGAVELALKLTHDQLIDGLGFRRRSGVRWTRHLPAEAITFLRTTAPDSSVFDEMVEHLSDPWSLLVVAWAIGAMPEGVTFGTWDPATGENSTDDRLMFVALDEDVAGGDVS